MARDVVELLQSCSAWIDPNLLSLVRNSGKLDNDENNIKRKRRRRGGNNGDASSNLLVSCSTEQSSSAKSIANDDQNMEEDRDEFAFLGTKRIFLERASHVSDASSVDDEPKD